MEKNQVKSISQTDVQLKAQQYYDFYQDDPTMKINAPPCSLRQLLRFADRYDFILMIIGTLFSLGNGVSLIFYAQPFGQLVDAFAPGKDKQQIVDDTLQSVKLFGINSAVVFASSWFMSAAWAITSQRQMNKARKAYFSSLMLQEVAWHDRNRPAQVCSKMYIEISKVHKGLINNVTSMLTKISIGISGIIIALTRGWQMALIMLAFLPFMTMAGFASSYFLKKIQKFSQKTKSKFDSEVIQVFDNIRTVRMLDGQNYETERYEKKLKTTKEQYMNNGMKNKIAFAIFFFCILMNYSLGFWYGAKLVSDGTLNTNSSATYSVGDVMIIFFTLYISNLSLSGLPESVANFNICRISMKRVCLIIDRQSRVRDGKHVAPKQITKITFQNVGFQYERPLFEDFNLILTPGVTALIGESGSGKTTIINLILRFYDIFGGRIYLSTSDNQKVNITDLTFDSLSQRIGYVGQEPVLIGKTLREALTAENISDQDIISLLKKVKAWDFVEQIGLDSEYSMLSGGQKQRIAIARALIKNPEILILDEGTSALDRTNEQQVLNSIKKLGIPFVIMIAHRMQTVINADRIIRLEKGQISASGTYQQLVSNGIIERINLQEIKIQTSKSVPEQPIQKDKKDKEQILKIIQKHQEGRDKQEQSENDEDKDQKQFQMKYILRLMGFNKKYWYLYLIGIIASIFIGAIFPVFAYLLSNIVVTLTGLAYQQNQSELDHHRDQVRILSISLFMISAGGLIIQILRGVSFTYLTEQLGQFLKKTAFRTSINKSMVEIDGYGAQNLGHIVTSNCQDLKHLGGYYIGDIIENITTILVGLAIAFAFSWQITLVALAVFPLIILSGKFQMSFSQGMQSNTDRVHKKTHEAVIESIMYIKTVKSLNLQNRVIKKYSEALEQALNLAIKYGNLSGAMFGLGQTLISVLLSLIFFFGALMIKADVVTVLDLFTSIYAIMFAGVQAGGNMLFLSRLSVAKYAACNYFEIIANQEEGFEQSYYIGNNNMSSEQWNKKIQGDIQLNDVQFKYVNREKPIFKNFSLKITPGSKVALVGESGSGKSTITNIIYKIYPITSGEVLIDGQNLSTYSASHLRRQFGIVSQEPALFNRSIYENIKYNCKNATFEDVLHASKMAKAYDFILNGNFGMKQNDELEDLSEDGDIDMKSSDQIKQKAKGTDDDVKIQAFNKKVGTRGSFLSGGQKQRIAIARALIRNPSVIVLDQATSALDNQNQKMVQEAIEGIKGVTQIVIAHRLSTVENSDKIVAMKKGKIIQQGSYQELMKKGGYFYKLVNALKQEQKSMPSEASEMENAEVVQAQ